MHVEGLGKVEPKTDDGRSTGNSLSETSCRMGERGRRNVTERDSDLHPFLGSRRESVTMSG